MKTHLGVLALLAISMTMLIAVAGSSLVSAQIASPCTTTLSLAGVPAQYSNSNFPLVVPVSVSCTTYFGTQLYATGSAYDVTSNTGLGTASTLLSSVNGGMQFNGQLGFNVPPTSAGDSVQISVSIYDSQGGNLITTTGETIPVGAGIQQPVQTVQQVTTTTVTEGQYPYANALPTAYPSTYQPSQSQYYQTQLQAQGHQTHFFSQGLAYRSNNTNLFDYVVIIAIIASVIIATAGLVLVVRRQQQPTWYRWPPLPPQ
ncbi:MAG TPA: hypothetical protein VEG61_01895 [Candidatus Dormibacteraeota bacterium]|nr:hypothetical protein [Candidatus Dormibacteraeota bacterium]